MDFEICGAGGIEVEHVIPFFTFLDGLDNLE